MPHREFVYKNLAKGSSQSVIAAFSCEYPDLKGRSLFELGLFREDFVKWILENGYCPFQIEIVYFHGGTKFNHDHPFLAQVSNGWGLFLQERGHAHDLGRLYKTFEEGLRDVAGDSWDDFVRYYGCS